MKTTVAKFYFLASSSSSTLTFELKCRRSSNEFSPTYVVDTDGAGEWYSKKGDRQDRWMSPKYSVQGAEGKTR